jgi:hypothetical protein
MGFDLTIINAQELVGSGSHIHEIRFSFGTFLVKELIHRLVCWFVWSNVVIIWNKVLRSFDDPILDALLLF